MLKNELAKMAEREKEAVREEMVKAMSRERQQARKEAEKTKELVHAHTHTHHLRVYVLNALSQSKCMVCTSFSLVLFQSRS